MKKTMKLFSLVLCLAMLLCFAVGCGGSGDTGDVPAAADNGGNSAAAPAAAVDYTAPDVTIEYGDFDGISAFAEALQGGSYDGQVVKVDGISSTRMSNCAIMEADADGSSKVGFTWQLEGKPELSEYPADGAHVVIVGVIVVGDYNVRYLEVPADQVTVLD